MAKPYSEDFRQKVMQAIELDGLKKCEASLLFNIIFCLSNVIDIAAVSIALPLAASPTVQKTLLI